MHMYWGGGGGRFVSTCIEVHVCVHIIFMCLHVCVYGITFTQGEGVVRYLSDNGCHDYQSNNTNVIIIKPDFYLLIA